jgi:hypothetical protein
MNRVATRMVWSICCVWALSGCAAADETGIEPVGDITADVVPGDGADSAEVTSQDAEVPEVLETDDAVADGQAMEDTSGPEDTAVAQDTTVVEDAISTEDTSVVEDTAPAKDIEDPQDVSSPGTCEEPNPAGCTQTLCAEDEVCDPSQGCNPSSCFCDAATGEWDCSKDCGGGVCVPKKIEETACPGANPAGCANTGCPDGYSCVSDPQICIPSTCSCDEAAGLWICTEDCGGGVCQKDEMSACDEPDPTSCTVIGCEPGFQCDPSAPGGAPSSCSCDEAAGVWICTQDAIPGQCLPIKEPKDCLKPDPTSCSIIGCQEGFVCDLESDVCGASECTCNEATGTWLCSKDCLPGECVPAVIGLCSDDELNTPEGCMSCSEVVNFVAADAANVAQSSAADCEVDADCVMAQALSGCIGLCPVAVKSMWAGKYVNKIKLVSDAYCQGFEEKCLFKTPVCELTEPACVGGVCQAVPMP